jgi:hypothetical protein
VAERSTEFLPVGHDSCFEKGHGKENDSTHAGLRNGADPFTGYGEWQQRKQQK